MAISKGKSPEAGRGKTWSLPESLWRKCRHVDILFKHSETDVKLLASRTVRKSISIVLSQPVCGNL